MTNSDSSLIPPPGARSGTVPLWGTRSDEEDFDLEISDAPDPDATRIKYTLLCLFGLIVGAAVTIFTYDSLGFSKIVEHEYPDGHVNKRHVPTNEGYAYIVGGSLAIGLAFILLYAAKQWLSNRSADSSGCSMGTCLMSSTAKKDLQERQLQQLAI